MKQAIITIAVISILLNIGLISGYVRIGEPGAVAYTEAQRNLMNTLASEVME